MTTIRKTHNHIIISLKHNEESHKLKERPMTKPPRKPKQVVDKSSYKMIIGPDYTRITGLGYVVFSASLLFPLFWSLCITLVLLPYYPTLVV